MECRYSLLCSLEMQLYGHQLIVLSLKYSSDGTRLGAASLDGDSKDLGYGVWCMLVGDVGSHKSGIIGVIQQSW